MKGALIILMSSLLLCGCSQKQAALPRSAIDLVEAGKDSAWEDGVVLHVAKRDGNSIEGIQIITTASDGKKATITADRGKISQGPVQNSLKIILLDAHRKRQTSAATMEVMTIPELTLEVWKKM